MNVKSGHRAANRFHWAAFRGLLCGEALRIGRRRWSAGARVRGCGVLAVTALLTCSPGVAFGQGQPSQPGDAQAQDAKPVDLLPGAVDPFHLGSQRSFFLLASGVDTEMSAEEFAADQSTGDGFAQPYDRWPALLRHDRNGNGAVDWFEAQAYRQAVRSRIVTAFDSNKDGRLTGSERDAANAMLIAGRLPDADPADADSARSASPAAQDRRADVAQPRTYQAFVQRYDANGDGRLDDDERRAAREAVRDGWRQRFDRNGDGQLDEQERRAMREQMRSENEPFRQMRENWLLGQFDADGDGSLSESERESIRTFESNFRDAVGKAAQRVLGVNPREMNREQAAALRAKYGLVMVSIPARMQAWADANGDGQASEEELTAYRNRAATAAAGYFNRFTNRFDADQSGRLDAEERDAMLEGMVADMDRRARQADADSDGELSTSEMDTFVMGWLTDLGFAPVPTADESSRAAED